MSQKEVRPLERADWTMRTPDLERRPLDLDLELTLCRSRWQMF